MQPFPNILDMEDSGDIGRQFPKIRWSSFLYNGTTLASLICLEINQNTKNGLWLCMIINRQYFFQYYMVLCIETGKITDVAISDDYQKESYEMCQLIWANFCKIFIEFVCNSFRARYLIPWSVK